MAIAAGKLRHKVTIQYAAITQDPNTGAMIENWTELASVWASVEPLSAREFISAGAEQSEVKGKIIMRRRDDVNATMRILYRGLTYQILGVLADPISGLEYMTLPVGEGVRVA